MPGRFSYFRASSFRRNALGLLGAAGLAGLAGLALGGCGGSRPDAAAPGSNEPLTNARRVYVPHRGRLLDRHDRLLVADRLTYYLALPSGPRFDSAAFNRLLGWPTGAVQARLSAARRAGLPAQLALNQSEADTLRHHARQWPGLSTWRQRARAYATNVAGPVLGYRTSEAGPFLGQAQTLARGLFFRLRNGGTEAYYNDLLTGRRGAYHPRLDAHGHSHGSWATDTTYRAGQDLHLSLDLPLQAYAERLLGERKGYVVALEPATGEILACVSAPTYDAAVLTAPDGAARRRAVLLNPNRPLLNRPALLANPPGSVFKLVNAAVALQLGAIKPDTSFRCDQSLISCVHYHPRARNLTQALRYSCNPYFYQVFRAVINQRPARGVAYDTVAARHINLAAWRRTARSFGLDTLLGVDIPREMPGLLPSPAYYDYARRRRSWTFRSIYSLSIGQGEINLTGLQTANVLACVANRGWFYPPHFVRGIGRGGPLPRFLVKHKTLVDSVHFAALIPGMLAALGPGGTAEQASLADVGITVAGKTGTVQNDQGDDHATFAGFAPATRPRIVVAVYLENAGFGGVSAAPLAALLMEKYLRGKIAPRRQKWDYWLRCGNLHRSRR